MPTEEFNLFFHKVLFSGCIKSEHWKKWVNHVDSYMCCDYGKVLILVTV